MNHRNDPNSSAWIEHRTECEEGIIAGIMADPTVIPEVASVTRVADFTDTLLREWFRIACELSAADSFSVDRIRGELRSAGLLPTITELETFARLSESFLSANVGYHARELRRMTALESLRRACEAVSHESTYIDADPQQLAAKLEAHIGNVQLSSPKLWENVYTIAQRVAASHRDPSDEVYGAPVPTDFREIDRITGGYFPGQLWHVAARSYMGKTTMALAMAQRLTDQGHGVYFASYEMYNDELIERLLADKCGIALQKFTQRRIEDFEMSRVDQGVDKLRDHAFLLDENPPTNVNSLKARVKYAASQQRLTALFIDHLGQFPSERGVPRHQQLVEITRDLKQLAKDLRLTVVLLNQLNADADGEIPTDKHYSEGKGILQHLDVSMLLHRESKIAVEMLCRITKNKKGKPDECTLIFDGEIQRVSDMPGANSKSQWQP